jgi:hypothetical protein
VKARSIGWYARRLRQMKPSEVAWRTADQVRKMAWARRQVAPGTSRPPSVPAAAARHRGRARRFDATFPAGAISRVPEDARRAVVSAAEEVLTGRWEVLGVVRKDMQEPDWFFDPVTGRRAPQAEYCFRIDHRSEAVTGNVKQVWELSRMHHATVLAAAFAFTGDERFAETTARHLRSWWAQNPFLCGVNWTSGIELGLRLISWVWIRRLLHGWSGAAELFEDNDDALMQIWWHQRYLSAFTSRGSSSNNHVIAEAAGQLVASLAFPWFATSEAWGRRAAALLERELAHNTFPSGVNRELAFDYHGFVAELGLVAAVEADRAGRPLDAGCWQVLCRMLDVVAATVDERGRAPRQGDGDDGRGLVFEPSGDGARWSGLLDLGGAVFGAPSWWPATKVDAWSGLLASLAARHLVTSRPRQCPSHFADAGLTIMRTPPDGEAEIWCRCDAGPHGFLSIAAHAHADALSVEIRHGGIDILADPGTYCYHGEARWRSYFRSTLAHNTIEVDGADQSTSGGPFLWTRHAHSRVTDVVRRDDGTVVSWSAEHDGYASLDPPVRHHRTVALRPEERTIEIVDVIESAGPHRLRMAFHLGPEVRAELVGREVELRWHAQDTPQATMWLADGLRWSVARGATDPVLGWYATRFGEKEPATTLLGELTTTGRAELVSVLRFLR